VTTADFCKYGMPEGMCKISVHSVEISVDRGPKTEQKFKKFVKKAPWIQIQG